ncbi:hypothetical protein L9F63_016209 [Diploptera punctata]|uniref:Cns1/TTC4 wheel domain-containing protein n=1 Tax=Diploptera punctata TaxID=6984 RepID=A0AAD8A3E3_DIPPU|nr:hypothetical protein L9F63_016209 [Diploptera punctata]
MAENNNLEQEITKTKVPMTDEERRNLAEKLDKELDEYIEGLEKRSYTEGWPEDRWQEEMEKHPFFMTKAPQEGEELSPIMEGLQQLKYSETENTSEELAATAAAHYFLKSFRSCLTDCKAALKLRPEYIKCKHRAVQCCLSLHRYEECVTFCDDILATCPTDKLALELRAKAVMGKKAKERNTRKESAARIREEEKCRLLLNAVKRKRDSLRKKCWYRLIFFKCRPLKEEELSLESLEPCSLNAAHTRVHLDDDGCLVWPVMFLYPEYKVTDLIQEFHENSTFSHHLDTMFESPPDWDRDQTYVAKNLNIYYEDKSNSKLHKVAHTDTLHAVLSRKTYIVSGGTPCFLILVQGSRVEQNLLGFHNK